MLQAHKKKKALGEKKPIERKEEDPQSRTKPTLREVYSSEEEEAGAKKKMSKAEKIREGALQAAEEENSKEKKKFASVLQGYLE